MSAFEFVLILVAIVAAFAISEILAAWGGLIRARTSLRRAGLYCCSSLLLFLLIVRYVWLFWGLREAEWQFLAFFFRFLPMLVLALAAHVIALTPKNISDVTGSYFAQARPLYILLTVYFVLLVVADLVSLSDYLSGNARTGGLSVRYLSSARLIEAAVLLALAHVRRPLIHWAVLLVLLAALIPTSFVNIPRL